MSDRDHVAPICEIDALHAVCEDEATIAEMREVVQDHPGLVFPAARTAPPSFAECSALREVVCGLDSLSLEQRWALSDLLGEVGSALRIVSGCAQRDGVFESATLVLEPLAAAHAQLLEVWTHGGEVHDERSTR